MKNFIYKLYKYYLFKKLNRGCDFFFGGGGGRGREFILYIVFVYEVCYFILNELEFLKVWRLLDYVIEFILNYIMDFFSNIFIYFFFSLICLIIYLLNCFFVDFLKGCLYIRGWGFV